jgi:hypothetical protein
MKIDCPHCGINVAYHTASCPVGPATKGGTATRAGLNNQPVPTRLELLTREQALKMTAGEDRQFIIDHPGQTYLIHRGT